MPAFLGGFSQILGGRKNGGGNGGGVGIPPNVVTLMGQPLTYNAQAVTYTKAS